MTSARTRILVSGFVLTALGLVAGCPSPVARQASPVPQPAPPADAGVDAATAAAAEDAGTTDDPWLATYAYGKRTRRDPNDLCEPVKENLERAARAIVEERDAEPPRARKVWDRTTPPKYMPIVDARLALTEGEKKMLARNGFVVSPRHALRGYADALHDIYQSQLPIYVSTDAILFSIYKSNDVLMEGVERALMPRLETALRQLHEALPAASKDYPPEVARDLDVYLTVARSLLDEEDVAAVQGADAVAKPLVAKARAGSGGLVETNLFGRPRIIDFSQYAPRGHYAAQEDLQRYFRASMWLSRLELNLVSRSSRSSQPGFLPNPEETPREAVVALALADLAERAGVLGELDVLDSFWGELAGKREDVSLRALLALRKQAGIGRLTIPDSAEKLKAQIGAGFVRTTRMHYMPQGSTSLPVIATMLGPRVVADAHAETGLAHSDVPGREMPTIADVAFMLGHERARDWLAPDLKRFPNLESKLVAGKGIIERAGAGDLYAAWLGAIRAVATEPEGTKPSFMATPAFRDYRVNTAVAAFGELRHNYVLLAGQAYDMGGCEVPDGYVEPSLAVYEALLAYAERGQRAMKAASSKEGGEYFARLEKTLKVLVVIVRHELAGKALTLDERRWLSMVAEVVPPSSDGPGSNDGWYFDLFPDSHDAFSEHSFVADWYTSSNAGAIAYAGATTPRMGVFVVDTGGEPRVMVGPVARAFEHIGKLDTRLKDTDAAKLKTLREPWAASYTAPAVPAPPLQIVSLGYGYDWPTLLVRSTRPLGPVTIEYLGHHRTVIGKGTAVVGAGWTRVTVPGKREEGYAEIVRVRAGSWVADIDAGSGVNDAFGGMRAIADEKIWDVRENMRKVWLPKDEQ